MFEDTGNILTAAIGGNGRVIAGTSLQYSGLGIRKVGEFLVASGSWLEAQGAVMAAKGQAIKMLTNGQMTVLGAAALAKGQNPINVMVAEILSGKPLNMMGEASESAQPAQQQKTVNIDLVIDPNKKEEIAPEELAQDLC